MSDEFDFDAQGLQEIRLPVTYRGRKYVLREPDNGAVVNYEADRLRGAKLLEDGSVVPGDGATSQINLIAACLDEDTGAKNPDGNPVLRPVSRAFVAKMDGRAAKKLFEKIKEVGQIDDAKDTPETLTRQIEKLTRRRSKLLEEDAAPKGPPPGTPDTSA